LKNVGATYQRLMDRVFHNLIGRSVEIYVNDLVNVSSALKAYNLHLNLEKYSSSGVKANLKNCPIIIDMRSLKDVKEVQCLIWRLTTVTRFMCEV